MTSCPSVRSKAGSGSEGQPRFILRFRWSASYLRKIAHVMCDSSATQEDVIRLLGVASERTSVIPLGVESHFRPLSVEHCALIRRDLGLKSNTMVLFSVGRDAYKNPRGGLDCLAELRTRGVDARLLRSGRPLADPERAYARRMHVDSYVDEQGIVSEARLVELYNAADVLLHPSFWEGFGWPPLEAMACGTPVVTSTAASLLEIVGDAGIAAKASDVGGLVEGILRVTDPRNAPQWRELSLQRATRFSWGSTLRQITAIYDRVRVDNEKLDGPRTPRPGTGWLGSSGRMVS